MQHREAGEPNILAKRDTIYRIPNCVAIRFTTGNFAPESPGGPAGRSNNLKLQAQGAFLFKVLLRRCFAKHRLQRQRLREIFWPGPSGNAAPVRRLASRCARRDKTPATAGGRPASDAGGETRRHADAITPLACQASSGAAARTGCTTQAAAALAWPPRVHAPRACEQPLAAWHAWASGTGVLKCMYCTMLGASTPPPPPHTHTPARRRAVGCPQPPGCWRAAAQPCGWGRPWTPAGRAPTLHTACW